jgi:hypothetical protein
VASGVQKHQRQLQKNPLLIIHVENVLPIQKIKKREKFHVVFSVIFVVAFYWIFLCMGVQKHQKYLSEKIPKTSKKVPTPTHLRSSFPVPSSQSRGVQEKEIESDLTTKWGR